MLGAWKSLVSSSTAVCGVLGVEVAVAVGSGGSGVDDSLSEGDDEEGTAASLLLLGLPSSLLSICRKELKMDANRDRIVPKIGLPFQFSMKPPKNRANHKFRMIMKRVECL